MDRFEIRLSGAGGQGMILAGIILAEAGLDVPELQVAQTQSYGPESRGGASRAEVVFSEQEIAYPKVTIPDILVALTQEAYGKYGAEVKAESLVLVDEGIKLRESKGRLLVLPLLKTAREEVGLALMANILTLGVIADYLPWLTPTSLKKAIAKRVPAQTLELNLKAFELGRQLR